MTAQRIISTMAEWVPLRIKVALRGKRSSPCLFANAIHSVLNRLQMERYPILSCGGALKGFRMRVDWQLHRSFAYGTWEPEVVEAVQRHVTPGMTVLDVGAQTGFYSLLLSKLVGPKGKVIAFEPLPANFRLLEENVRLNSLENVTLRNRAVAEVSGEMKFEFPHHEPTLIGGPVLEGDSRDFFAVEVDSLDDFLGEGGLPVHFIKIDVEGAEVEVLRGARRMLRAAHPYMMIELHNVHLHSRYHPALPLLEQFGYQIEWLGEMSSTAHVLAQSMSAK